MIVVDVVKVNVLTTEAAVVLFTTAAAGSADRAVRTIPGLGITADGKEGNDYTLQNDV